MKKGKIYVKITDKEGINCLNVAKVAIGWSIPQLKMWLADLNYNFDVIGLLKCPITNCPITTWQVNLRKIGTFLNQSQSMLLKFLYDCTAKSLFVFDKSTSALHTAAGPAVHAAVKT